MADSAMRRSTQSTPVIRFYRKDHTMPDSRLFPLPSLVYLFFSRLRSRSAPGQGARIIESQLHLMEDNLRVEQQETIRRPRGDRYPISRVVGEAKRRHETVRAIQEERKRLQDLTWSGLPSEQEMIHPGYTHRHYGTAHKHDIGALPWLQALVENPNSKVPDVLSESNFRCLVDSML